MDPFAPAWLRIPTATAPSSSSSSSSSTSHQHAAVADQQQQQPSSSPGFSFRPAYAGINPSTASPGGGGGRSYDKSSLDHQVTRLNHAAPIRTSSLDDETVTDHPATHWKQPHTHYHHQYGGNSSGNITTGDRMRAKAASVSESSRHRLSHNNNNNNNNNILTPAVNKVGMSVAGGAGVPDFRELASFQFHTRSGSFGSEAVNGGSSGSSGSGASSADPCSSEDDISNLTTGTVPATTHTIRFPVTMTTTATAGTGRLTAATPITTTGAAAVPAAASFNQEFPSLAPSADVTNNRVGSNSSSVWDSSAKLKVMGGGMKKLWVKSNVNGKDAAVTAVQPQATNNKILTYSAAPTSTTTASMIMMKKHASAAATPAMEILVKNPKITSSRSDFFKSLRSSSSSSGSSGAAATTTALPAPTHSESKGSSGHSSQPGVGQISPPVDGMMKQQTSLCDDVFRQDSKDEGKENQENVVVREDRVGSVFTHVNEKEDDLGSIGRSADSILSSSLEAEQRLLKEMGWKEEEEDDFYEPLTEDEVREFRDLIIARKSMATTAAAAEDNMTSSKNIRNTSGNNMMGKGLMHLSSWGGKKGMNSSLTSPQEFHNSSSSSSDDDDDDSSDEDERHTAVTRIRHACS